MDSATRYWKHLAERRLDLANEYKQQAANLRAGLPPGTKLYIFACHWFENSIRVAVVTATSEKEALERLQANDRSADVEWDHNIPAIDIPLPIREGVMEVVMH